MIQLYDYKKVNTYKTNYIKYLFWYLISNFFFNTFIPGNNFRVFLLRLFGSKIGCNVIIKPFVKIKYPWKLQIGDYSWIGEEVWIDNIFNVKIGNNTCISQGVYICSANHHFGKIDFELLRGEVTIGNCCWISAKSVIGPNVNISDNSFVKLGEKLTIQFQQR